MYPLFILPLLLPLCHSFSLNTKTEYWGYTTNSLANTTSQQCKDAYSAEIHCDDFLVMLVNAGEERFFLTHMEQANFTDTCTATCNCSLTSWIKNVEASFSEDGDAALKIISNFNEAEYEPIPVETIGHTFQYMLMRSCAKDEDGEYCYMTQTSFIPNDFSCSWTCAVAYVWNQCRYPYSEWEFGHSQMQYTFDEGDKSTKFYNSVLVQNTIFPDYLGKAWKKIEECGFGNGTLPFDMGIEGDFGVDVSESGTVKASNSTADEVKSKSESSSNGTIISSDTENDGAGRVGFAGGWVIAVSLVLSAVYM